MRFKKTKTLNSKICPDWWARVPHPLFKNVLFVNHAQRPKFKYKLVKVGNL